MNALEMALEALENPSTIAVSHAIELIKKELAKPKQEPFAWVARHKVTGDFIYSDTDCNGAKLPDYFEVLPVYLAPPRKPWVGLTDKEIKGILDCKRGGLVDIKKAEQMLKEKNT